MPAKIVIKPAQAAPAVGPYNHAVRAGDLLFCAGQIPLDPATGNLVSGDIQAQTAQAEAKLSAARRWLLGSFEDITAAAAKRGHVTIDERMTVRLASTFAIHQSLEVVDMLYQAAGATAIFDVQPFERRFRDIHSVAQQLQGRQQHFETVGQYLLGLEADTSWL